MKIFLSYATKDYHYKDEIKKTLAKLERDGKIKLWIDEKKLKAGEVFTKVIESEIKKADMFLLLLSRYFWASDSIQTYELPLMLELSKDEKAHIIPIVLYDNYDLEGYTELNGINGLPRDINGDKRLKPIIDFNPEHRAYNVILSELIKVIDSLDRDILPLIQLSKWSLKILSPYTQLEKIQLKNISYHDNFYKVEIVEHYEDKIEKELVLTFDDNHRESVIYEFQNIRQFQKIKDRLSENRMVSRYEILNDIGATQETLFPVSSQIRIIENIIETEDIKNLIEIIESSSSKKILVHGSAGVGKTTTLSSFKSIFSNGLVIIFDSFGAGTYKDFASQRHLKKKILIQLINEIAIEIGLELVEDRFDITDLESKLIKYLKKASDIFGEQRVILIIDAGDNNIEGAMHFEKEPYIPKLWDINLPENCYLIMSARGGHRKDLLEETDDVVELELIGFNEENTKQFLLEYFPQATREVAFKFHQKTAGIPRLESYILEETLNNYQKLKSIIRGEEVLSLEDIFEDMWQQALSIVEPSTKEHLEELICLSRPASLNDFILASGLVEQEAIKTIKTLEPGIQLDEKNMIRFQDEDFENFIHSKLDSNSTYEAHKRIANNLLEFIESDLFSTKRVAFHLDKANEYQNLIEIALESNLLHISDRLDRREIEKDRVDRALNKALEIEDYKSVFKLLFIQAEITKSNDSLTEFLTEYRELLAIYTDEENALDYYLKEFDDRLGQFSYSYAYLIYKINPKKAKEFLKLGDAWAEETLKFNRKNNRYYAGNLDSKDLAKRGVVTFHLDGIKKCMKFFAIWNLSFSMKIIKELPKEFLLSISREEQEEVYGQFETKVHPFIQAQLLVLLDGVGNRPSKTMVYLVAKKLYGYIRVYPNKGELLKRDNTFRNRHDFNIIAIDFSQLVLSYGIESKFILPLVQNALIEENTTLRFREDIQNFDDNFFKIIALSEIEQDFSSIETLQKKSETSETIKSILPYYQLYVQTLLFQKSFIDIKDEWYKFLHDAISHWYYNQHRHFMIVVQRYKLLTKILIISNADRVIFSEFIQDIKRSVKQYNVIYSIAPILLYAGYVDEAFELIDLEIDRIRKEPDSSGEKVDNFNTFAEMIRPYDKDRARFYFELSLEATGGLDDRFYDLYKLTTSLSQYSLATLTEDEKIGLINKNIHIVESVKPYLYETHRYIINLSIKLIGQLDFSLALEVAHRWDNYVLEKLEDSLVEILPIAIVNQELSVKELFPLRYMIKKFSVIDSFLPILDILKEDKTKLFKALDSMIDFIQKNLSSDSQYILEKIEQWLKEKSFNQHSITIKLDKINSFHQSIKVPESAHSTSTLLSKSHIEDWDKLFESYLDNIPKNLKEIKKIVKNTYNISELLREGRKRLKNNQRVEWLDAIYNLDVFSPKNANDELFDCLKEWKYDLNIQKNSDRLVTLFIEKNSFRYSIGDFESFLNYKSKEEINKIILRKQIKSLAYMETRDIYSLIDKTKELLSVEDIKELVFYSIDKAENYFEAQKTPLVKRYDNQMTLVNLLWRLLGHSDRRERWKARHTVRELLKENHKYIPYFIEKLFSKEGFPFTNDVSFYTISARESLLIVFHRLSYEIEEILKPYMAKFEALLLDEEFPHIIIREIAKSIIFNLADEIDNRWLLANEPKSCLVENKTYGYGWNHETRFSFDSMDTIPYWYNNMQNIFNFEMITLLEKAESWIIDKWGQNDKIGFKDGYWGGGNNYDLTSHRQGVLPIIEEPKRHLEFETMFLVTGELIKNNSVNKGFYANDRYQEFLDDYFEINNFWCSEWRDIKPLEPFVHGSCYKGKEIERYDELLGLGSSRLCLDAIYSIDTEGFSETISIASTLVVPEISSALHKLLGDAENFDYCFPYIDEIYTCKDYKGYAFIAWIEKEYISNIQDTYDSYSDNFSTEIKIPSNEFIQCFDLEENKYKNSYKKGNKEIVKIERWADEDRSSEYEYLISKGDRMYFNLDTIVSYLNYKNMDMIIKVRIASTKKSYKDDSYSRKSVIYRLKLNGQVTKVEKEVEK